jgi:hypothetical protein
MENVASVVRARGSLALVLAGGVLACWASGTRVPVSTRSRPAVPQTHEDLCPRQLEVVRAIVEHVGVDDSQAVVAAERLMELAALSHDACRAQAAHLSSKLAHRYHARGHDAEMLASAERLYERYIATLPDGDDIASIRYFYAEALWSHAELETDPLVRAERWKRARQARAALERAGYHQPIGCAIAWSRHVSVR